MKKLLVKTLIAASVASFGLGVQAQEVTLKVHHFLSATTFIQVGVFVPWCDKLAKESANRIKCQIYPAMQLGGTPRSFTIRPRMASRTSSGQSPATQRIAFRCRKYLSFPS